MSNVKRIVDAVAWRVYNSPATRELLLEVHRRFVRADGTSKPTLENITKIVQDGYDLLGVRAFAEKYEAYIHLPESTSQ